jgi:transposase
MKTTDRTAAAIGLDVHRRFSTVTARNAEGKIAWRQRLEHEDRDDLRKHLETWPRGIPVILESSFGWEWMCEELEGAGVEAHLASSRKVAAWRSARGMTKSNRTDADLLSELGQQTDRWWQVWLPPPEVRDRREWMRYRMSLVRLQTGLKNRIHAILHRHGILHDFADLFGAQGRRMLTRLVYDSENPRPRESERATLPESGRAMLPESGHATLRESGRATLRESGRATLKGNLQLLDHLRRQIAAVTRTIYRQLRGTPQAKRLQGLPGVGPILAHTILAEVGDFGRFRSAKHLASYSLLAPRAFDSGEETGEAPKGRHVGHMGRRTLKWAWIEAGHGAVRRGGRFREVFDRYTDGGKRNRNRGYILVGHELCRTAYAISKKETEYRDDPPPRPGSPKKESSKLELSTNGSSKLESSTNGSSKKESLKKERSKKEPLRKESSTKRAASREDDRRRGAKSRNSRPGTGQPDHGLVVVG